MTALIVGGVVVGIAVLVLALTSLGGGGKSATTASTPTIVTNTPTTHRTSHGGKSSTGESTANPASTSVAVLNGTGTAGLAHRLSATLKQSGYARATALNARPAGVHQVTIVEYAGGHRGDAEGVAHSLGVAQVQPMEAATVSLAGASTVAVIAGADKANGP